eukprot:jgi/Chlat1/1842/Chrsp14S00780
MATKKLPKALAAVSSIGGINVVEVEEHHRKRAWFIYGLLLVAFVAYCAYLVVQLISDYKDPSVTITFNIPREEAITLPSIAVDTSTIFPRFFPRTATQPGLDKGACEPASMYPGPPFKPEANLVQQRCSYVTSSQAGNGLAFTNHTIQTTTELSFTFFYRNSTSAPDDWCIIYDFISTPPMDPQTGFGFHLWFNGTFVDVMGADLLVAFADTPPNLPETASRRDDRWFYDIQTDVQGSAYLPVRKVNRVTVAKTARRRLDGAISLGEPLNLYSVQSISSSEMQYNGTQRSGAYLPPASFNQALVMWLYASPEGTLHIDDNAPLFGIIGNVGGAWSFVGIIFFMFFVSKEVETRLVFNPMLDNLGKRLLLRNRGLQQLDDKSQVSGYDDHP